MIVFPMAGQSKRFFDAGYTQPKFMLEAHGRTIFESVLLGFTQYFDKQRFIFVALNEPQIIEFIRDKCALIGLQKKQYEIIVLESRTEGQAQTVAEGLSKAKTTSDQELIIFNIDTIRPGFRLPPPNFLARAEGYLEVFTQTGNNWSFVLPSRYRDDLSIERVTEKVRISDLCSTGLYYFKHASLFIDAYRSTSDSPLSNLEGGERYIAPLYNILISEGRKILYHKIPASAIIPCGTPEEFAAYNHIPDPYTHK